MHFSSLAASALLAGAAFAAPSSPHQYLGRRQNDSSDYAVKTPPLDTDWTYKVGTNPWPEYPRPQLERTAWKNLNGVWRYRKADSLDAVNSPPTGQRLESAYLVPSCLESGLSGVQAPVGDAFFSWFSTSFDVPTDWEAGNKVLLNFAAVDYEATVFVNGQEAGFHRGGYFGFTVDATQYLSSNGTNELLVFVHDPTDSDGTIIPIGKQTIRPSHIFYTPCSGIWQSVWIESAPADAYVTRLDLSAGADGKVDVTVLSSTADASEVTVSVLEPGTTTEIGSGTGTAGEAFSFNVASPKLWGPGEGNLYDVVVRLGADEVKSYTGFRTISKGTVNGIPRNLINNKFVFQFGTLDQGFWPDGIYTPPNREAMVYDLEVLLDHGFNMVRKHIKVEPALFYRACDELGLLVIQDMPSLALSQKPNAAQQTEFNRQLELLINQHKSYPSIYMWVIYNEGWGQLDDGSNPEFGLVDRVRELDPTRLINANSGWNDHGAGDFDDNHHYANPQCGSPTYSLPAGPYDGVRIGIQGEFGGLGHNVSEANLWKVRKAVDEIAQTYEINADLETYNYRAHQVFAELIGQIERYSCSAGVYTQTTDVEGEVNGLLTYDRRILRTDKEQWRTDIQAMYDAAAARGTDPN